MSIMTAQSAVGEQLVGPGVQPLENIEFLDLFKCPQIIVMAHIQMVLKCSSLHKIISFKNAKTYCKIIFLNSMTIKDFQRLSKTLQKKTRFSKIFKTQ